VSEENYLNDIASSGIGFRYNGSTNSGKITSVGNYFTTTGYYELSNIYITFISGYTYDNFTIGIRVEEIPTDGKTFLVGQGPIVHQKELEEAIGNIDTVETDPTVPEHVKTISEADISNWNGKVETSDLSNYLPKSGGSMTGSIRLSTNTGIGSADGKNLLSWFDEEKVVYVGETDKTLYIQGSRDRPQYINGSGTTKNLALSTDIPSLSGYATETYVNNAIKDLIGSAPDTLNTLEELATAINNNKGIIDALGDTYLPLSGSKAMTGKLNAPKGITVGAGTGAQNSVGLMFSSTGASVGANESTGALGLYSNDFIAIRPYYSSNNQNGIKMDATSLFPTITSNMDLGTSTYKFKNLYLSGTGYAQKLSISTPNVTGIEIKRTDANGGAFMDFYAQNQTSKYTRIGAWTGHGFGFIFNGNASTSIQITTDRKIKKDETYTYTLPNATGTLALTSDLSGYAKLSGGNTFTGVQHIKGTAANKPLWVRGIQGCLEDGVTENELHLNYQSDYPVKWGSSANSTLNSDGSISVGGGASITGNLKVPYIYGTDSSKPMIYDDGTYVVAGNASRQLHFFSTNSELRHNRNGTYYDIITKYNIGSQSVNSAHKLTGYNQMHEITGSGGNPKWVKLGTLSSTSDNHNTIIRVYSGNGYNGSTYQNSDFEIHIKDGYQNPTSTTKAFGCTVYGNNSSSTTQGQIQVKIMAQAHNSCDVWCYLPWGWWNGGYTVDTQSVWTHSLQNGDDYTVNGGVEQDVEIRNVFSAQSWDVTNDGDNLNFNRGKNLSLVIGPKGLKTNGALGASDGLITGEFDGTQDHHAIKIGKAGRDYCEFLEYGGDFRFIKRVDGTSTTVATITQTGITSHTGYFNAASDKRLKENIIDIDENSLKSFIENTPIKTFNYKSNGNRTVGVIAQDIENLEIDGAKFTSTNEEGYLQVHETKFVYLLWNYCQQLNKRIKELESKVK
jgi:hypothetical protein